MAASTESHPHQSNFCGGNFQDWLEVNLLQECNGRCSWCIERNGYHPQKRATWLYLANVAFTTGKKNIILLGGEPLLYPNLGRLVHLLAAAGRNVWITTNGSLLTKRLSSGDLDGVAGVNISIHHHDLNGNAEIVGVHLELGRLRAAVSALRHAGASVRFNCNLIRGWVDSEAAIRRYIRFAREVGATGIRFAELKQDGDRFVDLCHIFGNAHGITADPFLHGCNHDTEIDGMPVNFRQMCGLQTTRRPRPVNPVQYAKQVLYYDGVVYRGWQCPGNIDAQARRTLLQELASGEIEVADAAKLLGA